MPIDTLHKIRFKRLKNSLTLAFMCISLLPLTVVGLYLLESHSSDLEHQSHVHLTSVNDSAVQQLSDYIQSRKTETLSFARSELAYASGGRFYGLINAFRSLGVDLQQARQNAQQRYVIGSDTQLRTQILRDSPLFNGSERYRLMHLRYHERFLDLVKRSEFDDILLVDVNGNVAYSVYKHDYFGTNLLNGRHSQSSLGSVFAQVQKLTDVMVEQESAAVPVVYSDFNLATSSPHAWFAAPIVQQGYLHSYVMMRLPKNGIDAVLVQVESQEIDAHLLNANQNLLSSNRPETTTQNTALPTLHNSTEQPNQVESLRDSDNRRFLVASSDIVLDGFQWTLLTALSEDTAFAGVHRLQVIFVVIMITTALLITLAAHYLSLFITSPLLRLTQAAERVSTGELTTIIGNTDRRDEIGRLALSFQRMQASMLEKIDTIKVQNRALEQHLEVISSQNAELKQADKLKDNFLATTSHELRTPLHGMVGIAESLIAGGHGTIPKNQRYQLDVIVSCGQRLSNLVDNLLDYHKMRYGHLEIHPQAIDIANATALVLEISSHLIGDKPVTIVNQIEADTAAVFADPERTEQVLYNLIGNAIKYTAVGKIVLSASPVNSMLQIDVTDTGSGIAQEDLEQIFEPLTHASTEKHSYQQGAGLGLPISRQLVEVMGGKLSVSSRPQVGTTFSFTLPIATTEQVTQQPDVISTHFASPETMESKTEVIDDNDGPLDGKLILVVDDEPINIQILNSFLHLEGYRVITALSGAEALDKLQSQRPNLVLLDVMMPEMSGFEVCKVIRERFNRAELPVIMLTALSQSADKVAGFEAGANDYLSKPFNQLELGARLTAHLEASNAQIQRYHNQRLKDELALREQVEANLLETQGRLLEQLETAPEPIIAISKQQTVAFANPAASKLFGVNVKPLTGASATELIAPKHLKAKQDHWVGEVEIYTPNGRTSQGADILPVHGHLSIEKIYIFHSNRSQPSERILQLEQAIESLSEYAFAGDKQQLQRLKELGGEFTRLADKVSGKTKEKQSLLRETLVETMTCALDYWESTQGQTKFTFAEQSGLWRVYLDRSTLQTRTLDKYLRIETLPKTPRWRTVIASIDYILDHTAQQGSQRYTLERHREKLQKLLVTH